ncbi:SDR family NAD(P)-dependent oxidoreductase [Sphingobacterium rhinopitheci]|uniref:SDR family NAD(P)-dependent oxidoreductase n=1 Tax=Sphingobacterium rhinopitheci TaxID=2781960 RepID=UPI001F525E5A|nr:SDR family NAD(P)-dependent oxidoreductase [Sphingobacterium rhinopitheci]MCI0922531.1 SDR family NAD(P)-dependent oxidoreductase [Sphingobacterium rhinopitheci]
MKQLSILISGSGSGMGLLAAKTLIKAGHHVYAGIRDFKTRSIARANDLTDFAAQMTGKLTLVDLDIKSQESCFAAVQLMKEESGIIDVVIHNAAHLFSGLSEAFTPEQLQDSLDTNVVGAHRLNKAVLPIMRKQENGYLIYIGSAVSAIINPFFTPYIVGKQAMDALAESTAYELRPFGIESTILMPGLFMDGTSHFLTAVAPEDQETLKEYKKLEPYMDRYENGLRKLFRPHQEVPVQGIADEVARLISLPKGNKPLRTSIDYSDYGAEAVNAVREAQTFRMLKIIGFEDLLTISTNESSNV